MNLVGAEEIEAISKVINSQKLFRYQGKNVETESSLFEKEFSKYIGTNCSILTSSGTNALVNALFTLGVKKGDEVLVSAYTFFATIAAIIEIGATPVFINVLSNLTINLNEAQEKITTNSKALILVHMDGFPENIADAQEFCCKNKLLLIEDVAQAVGGEFKGKKLGSFGQAGCFSFNMDKLITCGEGGAVSFCDEHHFLKAMMYHDTCNQFGPTFKESYVDNFFVGKSMRVSEIQAAMIRVQLLKIEKIKIELRSRYKILREHFLTIGLELVENGTEAEYCGTHLRLKIRDSKKMAKLSLVLNMLGLKALPLNLRNGHNLIHWEKVLRASDVNFDQNNFSSTTKLLGEILLVFIGTDIEIENLNRIKNKIIF